MFPTIGFLAHQILEIVGSQIMIKTIFFSTCIFINLRRCCLQSGNLEIFIFVSKNWPNDFRNDSKPLYNLVEMIKKDLDFEKFEGFFEHDEFVNI
jgi:hypothetical protein